MKMNESDDFSDTDAETMWSLLAEMKEQSTRTRAAPFYNELAPGYRARAKLLAPPWVTRNVKPPLSTPPPGLSGLEPADDRGLSRSSMDGSGSSPPLEGRARRKRNLHLDDEKGPVDRSRKDGAGNDDLSSIEGDSDCSEGKDQDTEGHAEGSVRPSRRNSKRIGKDESRSVDPRNRGQESSDSSKANQASANPHDQGRCSNKEHAICDPDSGGEASEQEGWWTSKHPGRRLDDGGSSRKAAEVSSRNSLLQWASHILMDVRGRPQKLINRILNSTSPSSVFDEKLVYTTTEFEEVTRDLEEWTDITCKSKNFNSEIFQGLSEPKWRRTIDLKSGQVIESRPYDVKMLNAKSLSPSISDGNNQGSDASFDVQTTVWFGQKIGSRPKKNRTTLRRNLLRGIQTCAAVFLLEAMVLMTAGEEWAGAWTQRLYGTGSADIWEVFGNHGQ
jgi:hypothetical protein